MIRVDEPATVATDWILAALATFWAAGLIGTGAARGAAGAATLIWGVAFIGSALAAALGGVVHGFARRMGDRRSRPLWRATLHLVTLASAAMLAAALLVFPDSPARTAGLVLTAVKLGVATVLLARRPAFVVALVDHAVALVAVLALQFQAWRSYEAASAAWISAGIGVAVVAGLIQALRVAPHPRFNHNDLYHVVQIGAMWLLFRGGLLLIAR